MMRKEIIEFYNRYKTQIFNEMKEYMDIPLKNFIKINKLNYSVFEDEIRANFTFRPKYFTDSNIAHRYFPKNTDKTFEISWMWDLDMDDKFKTPQNFLRVTANLYKILDNFIKDFKPNVITFSGLSKGHDSIYFGDTFLKRLKTLFYEDYDIITDKENSTIYIIDKHISLLKIEAIEKRARMTSINESILYWKYNHLHPNTPNNVKIKKQIKNKTIKKLYF